jgi:hypothetical protein
MHLTGLPTGRLLLEDTVRHPIRVAGTAVAAATLALGLAPAAGAVTMPAMTADSAAVATAPSSADVASWYWKCRWPSYRHAHPWRCHRHHYRNWDNDNWGGNHHWNNGGNRWRHNNGGNHHPNNGDHHWNGNNGGGGNWPHNNGGGMNGGNHPWQH